MVQLIAALNALHLIYLKFALDETRPGPALKLAFLMEIFYCAHYYFKIKTILTIQQIKSDINLIKYLSNMTSSCIK